MPIMPSIDVAGDHTKAPPRWAVLQRHVFDKMADAASVFVDTYTRPDGTLIWHEKDTPWRDAHGRTRSRDGTIDGPEPMEWPGMDGSDDGYEAFFSIPLLYSLGGPEHLHTIARKQWQAVTWQFTQYGQVADEWDAHYDWMHHGESSQFIYYLGISDPHHFADRTRSLKFAGFYMGEGGKCSRSLCVFCQRLKKQGVRAADNFDMEKMMMRSPFNGALGAHTECTEFDWCTHRDQLSEFPTEGAAGHKGYLCPFLDHPIVPEGADWDFAIDWNDDEVFEDILRMMNERQASGDIPMNLLCTSLMTHACEHCNGCSSQLLSAVADATVAAARPLQPAGQAEVQAVGAGLPRGVGAARHGQRWHPAGQHRAQRRHRRVHAPQPLVGRLLRLPLAARHHELAGEHPRRRLEQVHAHG